MGKNPEKYAFGGCRIGGGGKTKPIETFCCFHYMDLYNGKAKISQELQKSG